MDMQTGLFNQSYFRELMTKECNRCLRQRINLSVMMLRLDYFDTMQNVYKTTITDMCLHKFSESVQELLRNYDTLCYFLNGKFAVLSPGVNINQAVLIAERIRTNIEKITVDIEKNIKIPLSVSIGVSSMFTNEKVISDIIERANKALLNAEHMGKNKVCKYLR